MNLNNYSKKREEGIISLMVMLGIGLFALGVALTVTNGILSEFSKNRNTASGDQVFYTAESAARDGAKEFIAKYLADPVFYINYGSPYSTTTNPDASLLINNSNLTPIEVQGEWPKYLVKVKANNSKTFRTTKHLLTVFPEGGAFDFAIYANVGLTVQGSATVNGNIFSNTDITLQGGSNTRINGDASAVEHINLSGSPVITGKIQEGVERIPPPQFNPGDYKQMAQASSTYFDTITAAKAYLNHPADGAVVYVDDPALLKLTGTQFVGTLVTKGDLEINGKTFKTADNLKPVLLVLGDLGLNGNTILEGIIYVKGITTIGRGTYDITGTLLSEGGISVSGNTTINFSPDIYDAWPDLPGLIKTPASPPKVLRWDEE